MAGIGDVRMGGVNVPSYPSAPQRVSNTGPDPTATALSGIGDLIDQGLSFYGAQQQQAAKEAETAALADVEMQLLDVEEDASQSADLFRATASADINGDGELSEEEQKALNGFGNFKSKLDQNIFGTNQANSMLRRKKRELIAQYPALAEHIVDRAAKAESLVQAETQLFANEAQETKYQTIYGVGQVNAEDYRTFMANESYLAGLDSGGAVTLNNMKIKQSGLVDTSLSNAIGSLNATFRENKQAFRNPADLIAQVDVLEAELIDQVNGIRTKAQQAGVPVDADELSSYLGKERSKITTAFNAVRESKNPAKVLGDITKVNELMVKAGLQSVMPQGMELAGQDGTNKTIEELVNLQLNGGPNAMQKFKAAIDNLPGDMPKSEVLAAIDFHAKLQDPATRGQYVISNPYRATAFGVKDAANGGGDKSADITIDGLEQLRRDNKGKSLERFYQAIASSDNNLKGLNKAPAEIKTKWQAHIEAGVKQLAQNLALGQSDAPGARVDIDPQTGEPTVVVSAMTGTGQQARIVEYPDKAATNSLRSAIKIYDRGGLGNGQELLSIFEPEGTEETEATVERRAGPTSLPASDVSSALEELEDLALTPTSNTLNADRAGRVRQRRIEAIVRDSGLSPEQANTIIERFQNGEDFEAILREIQN